MSKVRVALMAPERLNIVDNEGPLTHGCNQEWYGLPWQRMAGCGPSVASNLLLYLERSGAIRLPLPVHSKQQMGKLMNLVWKFVTPMMHGVNKTSIFSEGLAAFCTAHHLSLGCHIPDLPKDSRSRPDFETVVAFIARGLAADSPVAFLNLDNGDVENLDDWHWITIVGMEEINGDTHLTVYDNGVELDIDLTLWYATTKRDGGFVYLQLGENAAPVQEM